MTDDTNGRFGRRRFLRGLGATTVIAGLAGEGSAARDDVRLVVGVEDGSTIEEVRAQVAADSAIPGSGRVVHHNETIDYAVVEVPPRGPSAQAADVAKETVSQLGAVDYVETDYEVTTAVQEIEAVQPNDPRWGEEWAEEAMNVPQAWETTLGSLDTTLAILDTGLDYQHPDLQERVTGDVGGSDPLPSGPDDHGTHCGGCAAATTNNGVGVTGPANSRLLGYNIFDNVRGEDAIVDAVDTGADVISLSWSVGYQTQQSLADALQYAVDNGTVVLAASANDGRTDAVAYPAADPNVIAVGATDQNGAVANFSNSGPGLDLVAPGVQVLSTLPNSSYGTASGTSMACPCTAGVAALAKEIDPGLTPEEVRSLLTDTAVTLGGVPADRQAAGQVDAAAVVAALDGGGGGGLSTPTNLSSPAQTDTTVDLDWDHDGQNTAYYNVFVDGAFSTTSGGTSTSVTGLDPGTSYEFTVTADDGNGTQSDPSNAISVSTNGGGGSGRQPYPGQPHAVPGRIEAEDYDLGGEGVAYHDTTAGNSGGTYRQDDVDIESASEGGYNVGWIQSGEWLTYTVDVASAGTYQLDARVASNAGGGSFTLEQDGTAVGSVDAPGTGGWQSWTTVSTEVDLAAGEHTLTINVDAGGFNLNWIELSETGSGGGGGNDIVSGGVYRITNVNSGKALEVEAGSTADGANVQQWSSADVQHHRWVVNEVGDGVYSILAGHSGKALDVHAASTDAGTNVKQWEYVGGANQHWRIEANGDGSYSIVADHSDMALDVADWSTADGANVLQWHDNGTANQLWEFERLD